MPSKAALAAQQAARQKELTKMESTRSSYDYEQKAKPFSSAKVKSIEDSSSLFNRSILKMTPTFELSELALGRVLGKGGFSTVTEVLQINCDDSETKNEGSASQGRQFMSQHVTNEGDARYCIKALSPNVIADPKLIVQGTIDMAVETMFLSVITHPHIISMHAYGAKGFLEISDYFIVLDRLYDTLELRIAKWKVQTKRSKSIVNKMKKRTQTMESELMGIKLSYARDLMGALEYLHNKGLIYRDLKPENVGFNIRDEIVFFDFGLTREVHDKEKVSPTTWKLTGETGSPRYMAPEVYLNQPYGYSADVYSFGIMLHEMLSCFKPFAGYSKRMLSEVVVGKGGRPPLEDRWGASVNAFLSSCWNKDLDKRPTSSQASSILEREVTKIGDNGIEKFKARTRMQRRSTM